MDKRVNFASDLAAIHSEVTADVGGILEAVKARKALKTSGPSSVREPVAETSQKPQEATIVKPPKSDRPRRNRVGSREDADPQIVLENVTTRLHRETNELLTEASLHQRLKKVTPATRQDIVESAVQEWLQRNGYLESRKS